MSRRLPGNWFVRRITLVLVMVSSPCGMMAAGAPLYAQPTGSYEFDIPSQPLDQALKAFSATTDLLLSYEAGMTAGRTSSAIAGRYTPEEALRRLLADTGLDYRFANDKTVTLRPAAGPLASPHASPQSHAPASDGSLTVPADQKPVKVPEVLIKEVHYRDDEKTYVAEEANTATRTDTPIKDVPQSIQVITRKVIEEQRTFRLTDALANVSGINPQQSTLQLFDSVLIRGFPASPQNFFRNGLFDPTARFVASDVANIQRLEVLKGPASVLYGQGDPGGIINLVTRKGLPDPYYAGNVTLGNFDFYRSEIDATGPLNAGKTVMYRLNVAGQKAGSFMDFVRRDLAFVAPTITWLVSPRTTFTVEGDYTQRWYNNARGVPAEGSLLPNIHGELPRSTFLGIGNLDKNNRSSYRIGYDLTHQFNKDWSIRNAYRYAMLEIDQLSVTPLSLAADQRTLTRLGITPISLWRQHHHSMITNLVGHFQLLNMDHTLLTGVELRQDRFNPGVDVDFPSAPPIDIFSPNHSQGLGPNPGDRFRSVSDNKTAGFYLQDQVALLPNLKFLGGFRFDYLHQFTDTSSDPNSTNPNNSDDIGVSPRLGLVYQPVDPVSLYASWTRGFLPNAPTSFNPDGALFKPERSTQYEVGMKTFFLENRISATLAWFHLTRENLVTPDPINPLFSVQTGEQRSQGIELDVTASLLAGWNVIASYAYTDAEVTTDNNLALLNKRLALVPYNKATIWSTYHFQDGLLKGFGVGGGLFGYTSRNASIFGPQREIPGYVRVDAALYYDHPLEQGNFIGAKAVHAAVNIRNLLDQRYIELAENSTTRFLFGEPFTVLATVGLEF